MKKILTIILSLLLSLGAFARARAEKNYVIDEAGFLTTEQKDEINDCYEDIYEDYDIEVFLAIDYSIKGTAIVDYATALAKNKSASTAVVLALNEDYYYIDVEGALAEDFKPYYEYLWNAFSSISNVDGGAIAFGEAVVSLVSDKNSTIPEINSVPILDKITYVVDGADLLTIDEEEKLARMIEEEREKLGIDIVIVTANSLHGLSPQAYSDDFYDYNGFSDDGVLFLVSMEERDYHFSTSGSCIEALTDYGLEYIDKRVVPYLSDGEYFKSFSTFVELVDEFVLEANEGEAYDTNNVKRTYPAIMFGICPLIGLIIAAIYYSILKGQLNSVSQRTTANSYIVPGSFNITKARDIFVNRHVNRTPKPEREISSGDSGGGSTVHISSSGTSHGGRSGKF